MMMPSAAVRPPWPALAFALVLAWDGLAGPSLASPTAQEPVTTRVDLLDQVRRLKTLGGRVHLEWLYLEDRVDTRPDQTALVRSGQPVEFGAGWLYHGRDGLDEALASGRADGPSYLTRAPHVWAVGHFHALSKSPAILVVPAEGFNRLRNEGRAVLEAEIDHASGIMDPYPKILEGIPMDLVREIWIDGETADRYERLTARPPDGLSEGEARLKAALAVFRSRGKFVVIPGLAHTEPPTGDFYPKAYEAVGAHFVGAGLAAAIPAFRPRRP